MLTKNETQRKKIKETLLGDPTVKAVYEVTHKSDKNLFGFLLITTDGAFYPGKEELEEGLAFFYWGDTATMVILPEVFEMLEAGDIGFYDKELMLGKCLYSKPEELDSNIDIMAGNLMCYADDFLNKEFNEDGLTNEEHSGLTKWVEELLCRRYIEEKYK